MMDSLDQGIVLAFGAFLAYGYLRVTSQKNYWDVSAAKEQEDKSLLGDDAWVSAEICAMQCNAAHALFPMPDAANSSIPERCT